MINSALLKRSAALLATTASAAALTLIPASQAQALGPSGFVVSGNASADWTGSGGGSCTLTSSPGSDEVSTTPVNFQRGTRSRTLDMAATFTNSLDSTDRVKVKGHLKSTLTLRKYGNGDFRLLNLAATGSLTTKHTVAGSHCAASGTMGSGILVKPFKVSKRGKLAVSYQAANPRAIVELVVVKASNGHSVVTLESVAGHLKGSAGAALKPGQYLMFVAAVGVYTGPSAITKVAALRQSTSNDLHLRMAFNRS
jgi:hypothetical protein